LQLPHSIQTCPSPLLNTPEHRLPVTTLLQRVLTSTLFIVNALQTVQTASGFAFLIRGMVRRMRFAFSSAREPLPRERDLAEW
jgi:hypothetical protein